MSEMEHHKGTLLEILRLKNETLEEQCKRLLKVDEIKEYYDSYQEMFEREFYRKYVIHNGSIYKVEAEEVDPYDDIFSAYKNEARTINFEVRYYNGGCGFDEAIKYALDTLKMTLLT